MKDKIHHLISLDSIGGDAIYVVEDILHHISDPYDPEDITLIEAEVLDRIHYNESPNMKFGDFNSMISYVQEGYYRNKLQTQSLESIKEITQKIEFYKKHVGPEIISEFKSTELLQRIEESGVIEYFYPRYLNGNMFNFDTEEPDYIHRFRNSLRHSIKQELSYLPSKKIRLEEIQTVDFNYIVDDSLTGDIFILEPVYAGTKRKKRADFIQFGVIEDLCVIVNKHSQLYKDINSKLDIDAVKFTEINKKVGSNRITDPVKLLQIISNKRANVIMLPSTLITEEFNEIIRRTDNYLRIKQSATDDLDEIRRKLTNSASNTIALLDWQVAEAFNSKLRYKMKSILMYHSLLYSAPITVGIPYPKGDLKFKKWIINAINEGYLVKGNWDEEFSKHMNSCRVRLDEPNYLNDKEITA